MRQKPFLLPLLIALLIPWRAQANPLPGPLIDTSWLLQSNDRERVVLLDIQEHQDFVKHHLQDAVNLPFSQWRTGPEVRPPKSLPDLNVLAARLGKLGIDRQTPVVIVSLGQGPGDMSAAARVYWTLELMGHEHAGILDGGLARFVNQHGGKYVRGEARATEPTVYEPKPNLSLLAQAPEVMESSQLRLDARSLEEHVGLIAGQGERPGTLPAARHLPFDWLTEPGSAKLRPLGQLKQLFAFSGLKDEGAVHFCHTGNRASLTWFVDYALLGHKDARLYDGSMIEWGKDKTLPIETKIDLK